MVKWKLTKKEVPKPGRRIAIQLPDGRVCSAIVTETGGIKIEYVDTIDLFSCDSENTKWFYLD